MDSLNLGVLEDLKCPSCREYMDPPIYQCVSGHSICETCWNGHKCPICTNTFTDCRNYSLESIGRLAYYPCINEPLGCNRFFKQDELPEHVDLCEFRLYSCRLDPDCKWRGTKAEIKGHALENHDDKVLLGKENFRFWKKDKSPYEVYLIVAFKSLFYLHRKLKNEVMYWTVQYVGKSEDTILFGFQTHIFTEEFRNRTIVVSELCHDDTKDDVDENIMTGFCVAVPLHVLETYCNCQGVVFYKIRIKKL